MRANAALVALALLAACGGGGGGGSGSTPVTATPQKYLTVDDVRQVMGQAVAEASARGTPAVIAVVDRVGNVLAIHTMAGAPNSVVISSGEGKDGLETTLPLVPS